MFTISYLFFRIVYFLFHTYSQSKFYIFLSTGLTFAPITFSGLALNL